MNMRRPAKSSVMAYCKALVRYRGVPPLEIWRRYSLRTRAAAIYLWRNGKDAPLSNLPETPASRRRPRPEDL